MIVEVERILEIEQLEEKDKDRLSHLKVPHPYFHHRTKNIQCYGMEYIDGVTLEQAAEGKWGREGVEEDIKNSLEKLSLEAILSEIDIFYDNMHDYCLHGDMKPANMMIDRDGMFYIIDFGQSILVSHIPDKASSQLDVLRDDERKISKDAVKRLFNLYVNKTP
jgi:RIO-like serine/threonine protein kinase